MGGVKDFFSSGAFDKACLDRAYAKSGEVLGGFSGIESVGSIYKRSTPIILIIDTTIASCVTPSNTGRKRQHEEKERQRLVSDKDQFARIVRTRSEGRVSKRALARRLE